MSEAEKIFIFVLIENVEKNKCLYDKKDACYYNKHVKERVWKDVADVCNKSVVDCKHRWKLLRERIIKELKKKEAPSGSGMCYQEEWQFLQPMAFIKDSLAPRRTRDNNETDVSSVNITSEDSFSESVDAPPNPPKKKKLVLESLYEDFGSTMMELKNKIASQKERQETPDELFMKTALRLMKDLPLDVKEELQASFMSNIMRLRREWRNVEYCPE